MGRRALAGPLGRALTAGDGRRRLVTPSTSIPFTVAHRSRVTRRMHLELDPDGELLVVTPPSWSDAAVLELLTRNTARVERFLKTARRRRLPPLDYGQGGRHWYRGERFRLRLDGVVRRSQAVTLSGGDLLFCGPARHEDAVRNALRRWYLTQARRLFRDRLDAVADRVPWIRAADIVLSLRRMKRTWGTCRRPGHIRLNTHLVKAPPQCLDYVIAHELCHLREMNHGPEFYRLQSAVFPPWREARELLRESGHRYTQE